LSTRFVLACLLTTRFSIASHAKGEKFIMSPTLKETFLKHGFATFYDAYFQELSSQELVGKWQVVDIFTAFLIAVTASSSAVAGWALWAIPAGRVGWAAIAGVATVASIIHGIMGVPRQVKEQEDFRRRFSVIRVDGETYLQQVDAGLDEERARSGLEELRKRLALATADVSPSIIFTRRFRCKIQEQLNELLKERGYEFAE
jgi:hypothetical protein